MDRKPRLRPRVRHRYQHRRYRVDLARYRRGRQAPARRRHAPQRLPAIGLRVEHLRFSVEHRDHVRITPAHDIELAPQSRCAVTAARRGHAGDLPDPNSFW